MDDRTIGITQQPESESMLRAAADVRVVAAVQQRMRLIVAGPIDLQALLDVLAASLLVAQVEQGGPLAMVDLKAQSGVLQIFGQDRQLVGAFALKPERGRASPPSPVSGEMKRRVRQTGAERQRLV